MQLRSVLALPVVHVLAVREDRILHSDDVEDAVPLVGDVDGEAMSFEPCVTKQPFL
jgi:hypothetical protein